VDTKGILTGKNGRYGMNIYRGCSHGCIYCDSRSLCYRFTHAFEDIEVKQNAPALLEQALKSKRKKCMIGTGSMSDPYMHCEEKLGLTRKCLEVIRKYGFGAAVQTKSDRILRDIDLLDDINREAKSVVQMTLTTYDDELCSILEPAVCNTRKRIEVLEKMQERSIPTVVWLSPVLPYINDNEENIRAILDECVRIGVKGIICFGMGLTLRDGNREYYYAALDKHFPGLKEKYIKEFGNSYIIASPQNDRLMGIFKEVCEKSGIISDPDECFAYMQEFPEKDLQLSMFDMQLQHPGIPGP
ncbi:MAG: radical SAM protein, partial [Firmicutes bacterium]|nr:radical SAM protein [Bacillota bacterium]